MPSYNHSRGDSALTPCPICKAAIPAGVPLESSHILAADIVMRRALEFLDAVLPVLIEADPEEKLMKFVTPLQESIEAYTELRIGCATRCEPRFSPEQWPVPGMTQEERAAIFKDWPPAPNTERSAQRPAVADEDDTIDPHEQGFSIDD